jgi:formyl-CoA transferase
VRTSLLQAQIALLDFQAARYLVEGEVPGQTGNDHPTAVPMGLFAAADGAINIAASGQVMFTALCRALGLERLLDDPRFSARARRANRSALCAEIEAVTRTQPAAHWIELLNAAGVPCGPVNRMDEVFADPQVQHARIVRTVSHPRLGELNLVGQPIDIIDVEGGPRRAAPELGADRHSVLSDYGFTAEEIDRLAGSGVA